MGTHSHFLRRPALSLMRLFKQKQTNKRKWTHTLLFSETSSSVSDASFQTKTNKQKTIEENKQTKKKKWTHTLPFSETSSSVSDAPFQTKTHKQKTIEENKQTKKGSGHTHSYFLRRPALSLMRLFKQKHTNKKQLKKTNKQKKRK